MRVSICAVGPMQCQRHLGVGFCWSCAEAHHRKHGIAAAIATRHSSLPSPFPSSTITTIHHASLPASCHQRALPTYRDIQRYPYMQTDIHMQACRHADRHTQPHTQTQTRPRLRRCIYRRRRRAHGHIHIHVHIRSHFGSSSSAGLIPQLVLLFAQVYLLILC